MMSKLNKKPKPNSKKQVIIPEEENEFEVEEELNLPALPLTAGKDSTKPTAFDRLPWVSVKLPELIGDGLKFEADGGMLGLEELDGSVWEQIKAGRLPTQETIHSNHEEEEEFTGFGSDPGSSQYENWGGIGEDRVESEPFTNSSTVDKEERKRAKKARLALLRQAKAEQQASRPSKKPKIANEDVFVDEALEKVDWGKAADLDGMSDMDDDRDKFDVSKVTFDDALLPAWNHLPVSSILKHALHTLSFDKPTPVQNATLPISLTSSRSESEPSRDLVAIAETGSGKTLAYALPILNGLMSSVAPLPLEDNEDLPISALILTPTRELCLQVKAHIDSILVAMCTSASQDQPAKNRSGVSTVAVCGGIAVAKQRKQLERSKRLVDSDQAGGRGTILVATPGRLWDLIQSWDALANGIRRRLDWLVVDEADKMIEKGHFEEVEKILKLIKRPPQSQREGDWQDDWGQDEKVYVKEHIRTMVFSATMDKHLQINLKKNWRQTRTQKDKDQASKDPLEDLLERIDFRDEEPELIDLSPKGRLVSGLKECKIECVMKDKDLYLFHFLLRYSGRTLVFLSSISALRRLAPLFTLLFPNSTVLTLHSAMQQRARLKSLDKFRSTAKSIMLSTDVAARGLDIPSVDHVVHYQVPRTVDCYVHRSGRTARAGKDGVALVLIGPDELKIWRGLVRSLKKDDNLPPPPIEHSISGKLQELLVLAKKIDGLEHRSSKQAHETNWTKKTAEILEIDENGAQYDSDNDPLASNQRSSKATTARVRQLKAELTSKLAQPILLPRTIVKQQRHRLSQGKIQGSCFITDPALMERLLKGDSHEKVLGLEKDVSAVKELKALKGQKPKRKRGSEGVGGV